MIDYSDCTREEHEEFEEIARQCKEANGKLNKARRAYRNKIKKLGKWLDECEAKYE